MPINLLGQELKIEEYKTLSQWSESIETPNHFKEPHCIHIDMNGNLLITDVGASKILRFTQKGAFLGQVGKGYGQKEGYFIKPRDAAVSPNGNIAVTDQKLDGSRVQLFTHKGEFIKSFAEKGTEYGQIDWPHGLAFDSDSNIYVTDVANQRVNKYDSLGNFILDIGKNSPNSDILTVPHGLTITPKDEVFVSDYSGTIQKYSKSGQYKLAFRNIVHNKGSAFVHKICSDDEGNIYVMVRGIKDFKGTYEESPVENRSFYIAKYDNMGNYRSTIRLSDKGREIIQATVSDEGKIYALFIGNGRMGVEVLGKD